MLVAVDLSRDIEMVTFVLAPATKGMLDHLALDSHLLRLKGGGSGVIALPEPFKTRSSAQQFLFGHAFVSRCLFILTFCRPPSFPPPCVHAASPTGRPCPLNPHTLTNGLLAKRARMSHHDMGPPTPRYRTSAPMS